MASTYVMHGPGRGSTAKILVSAIAPVGMLIFGALSRHERTRSQNKTQLSTERNGHGQSICFQKRIDDSQCSLGRPVVLERIYSPQSSELSRLRDDFHERHGLFVAAHQ